VAASGVAIESLQPIENNGNRARGGQLSSESCFFRNARNPQAKAVWGTNLSL